MLRRYGDKAEAQTAARADELTTEGDHDGAVTWRRIAAAVRQLANTTPTRPAKLNRRAGEGDSHQTF